MSTFHPVFANDFSSMDDDALAAAVSTLAAHIHAATYRLLVLIAELDRREVWAAQGALSCAHWLSWACGIDTHTAREKVRVARALTGLPLLSEALAKGELGYSKVRALTRIATSENEADLLNIGLHGTAQHVEKFVRLHRRAKRAEETERADAQHENRGLTFWHDDDGTVVLHGRFPPEMGARILSALDAAMAAHAAEQPAAGWDNEGLAPEDVPAGTPRQDPSPVDATTDAGARERAAAHRREDAQVFLTDVPRGTFIRGPSRTVRRADALAWMAERLFESGDAPALAPDRHEIVVHVEAEVLADGRAGRCEIEHRTAIAAETARRLCCDAGIVPVVDGANGEPLSVGRRTRSIPPAVRRALSSRDRGCRFPGCPATYRLHGHHVKHWADGGETSLDNLILLCPTHHRLVHEGGFDVQRLDDGAFRFTNPHGLAIRPPRRRRNLIARHHHRPERLPRTRHRLRDRDCALARGTYRLRPCADGDDGVMGFGRHCPRGRTGGRRLESVVGEVGQRFPAGWQAFASATKLGRCGSDRRFAVRVPVLHHPLPHDELLRLPRHRHRQTRPPCARASAPWKCAICPSQNAIRFSGVGQALSWGTSQAQTCSPYRLSGLPNTCACRIPG